MIAAREKSDREGHSAGEEIRQAQVIPWVLVIAFGLALIGLCAASTMLFIR
jgi:hypothetical protein